MKELSLTRGFVALVDDEDYEQLSKYKWTATDEGYAFRMAKVIGGREKISMHRFLMGIGKNDPRQVDHINGNAQDNRKENLRICSQSENLKNYKKPSTNTSGYKGVSWSTATNKWKAQIRVNNEVKYLGVYENAEDAHRAYCAASEKYHGEFGRTA